MFLRPSRITLTIEFPALDRLITLLEQREPDHQPEIDALTARLRQTNADLLAVLTSVQTTPATPATPTTEN
jgi:hypothetical protein